MHNPSPETPAGPGIARGAVQIQRAPTARQTLYAGSEIYRRAAFGKNHPLNIVRHSAVLDLVRILDWLSEDSFVDTEPATIEQLLEFHDLAYIEALQYAQSEGSVPPDARERYRIGTLENPVFDGLYERASMTVGGSIKAAKLACEGNVVFHPSGGTHHGRPDRASGFCYFNDPVFAIRTFLDMGRSRVLYIDLDAHHGDGVEDAFVDHPAVMTISIHEEGRWPYSGPAGRRGSACNLPVPRGFNDSELEYLVDHAVLPLAAEFSPDAIVLCCGADCLAGDPLSAMELSNVALWNAIGRILDLDQPTVILGGGGYNPWTVARYWAGLWGHINGREMPAVLPDEAIELMKSMECDLIDDEDIEPQWLTTMTDSPNPGTVRDAVKSVANAVIGTGRGGLE